MMFILVDAEIKAQSGNGPYCFWTHGQICHFSSAAISRYGQLNFFDFAEATRKLLENQPNHECMAKQI
jgi:hypothetical protein